MADMSTEYSLQKNLSQFRRMLPERDIGMLPYHNRKVLAEHWDKFIAPRLTKEATDEEIRQEGLRMSYDDTKQDERRDDI